MGCRHAKETLPNRHLRRLAVQKVFGCCGREWAFEVERMHKFEDENWIKTNHRAGESK